MSTSSILGILAYSQYGYHMIYHTGLSLVHCSCLSVGSLHSDTWPYEKERARVLRASVQKDTWLAKLMKSPEREAVEP